MLPCFQVSHMLQRATSTLWCGWARWPAKVKALRISVSPCSGCTAPSGAEGGCTSRWCDGTVGAANQNRVMTGTQPGHTRTPVVPQGSPNCEEFLLKAHVSTLHSTEPEQRGQLGRTRRACPVLGACNEAWTETSLEDLKATLAYL